MIVDCQLSTTLRDPVSKRLANWTMGRLVKRSLVTPTTTPTANRSPITKKMPTIMITFFVAFPQVSHFREVPL